MKKGFTLVELLAIMVILGIMVILVVPQIGGSINSKKEKELNKIIDIVENAGRAYHTFNKNENAISIDTLVNEKYLTNDLKNPVTGEVLDGCIKVSKDDEGMFVYTYIFSSCESMAIPLNVELNGGTTTQSFQSAYYESTRLTLIDPIKIGYDFVNWSVVQGNSTLDVDGKTLIIGNTATTIYAMWESWPTLTVELDGGTTSQSFETIYKSGTTLTLTNPTKVGYKFDGWDVTSGNGIVSGSNFTMGSEDTTIKAKWTAKVIKVTYNKNDGTSSTASQQFTYGVSGNRFGYNTDGTPKWGTSGQFGSWNRTGYTLLGWSTSSTATSKTYDIYSGVTDNWIDSNYPSIALYAVWQINTYTITYNLNGGTKGTNAPTSGTYGSTVTVSNPTRTGYTFAGWTVSGTGAIISGTKLTIGAGNVTLTAKWKYAQAIYTSSDNTLSFVIDEHNYTAGETYNGKTITNVYTGFDTQSSFSADNSIPWYSIRENVKKVVFLDEIKPLSTAYWFFNFKNCENFDITKLNTSNVTDMIGMFYNAGYNAKTFNIGNLNNWNTGKVKNMHAMFYNAGYSATTFNIGDLSGWNTSNVTDMGNMIDHTGYSATTFNIGDLSGWNISKVTIMAWMFGHAGYSSTTFNIGNIGNWNTSNVTDMSGMFYSAGYKSTTFSIGDLSGWTTSKVTDMHDMFYETGYKSTTFGIGNLSGWNTSKVTNMRTMFYNTAPSATYSQNLSNWNVSNVTDHTNFNAGVTSKVTSPKWVS